MNKELFDFSREYVHIDYHEIKNARSLGARFDRKKNLFYVSKSNLELFLLKFTNLNSNERRYVYLIFELRQLFKEQNIDDDINKSISETKKQIKTLKQIIDNDMFTIEHYIQMEEHKLRRLMKNSGIHF